LRFCVGVFSSEWYFWVERDVPFVRVPVIGEWLSRCDGTDGNQVVEQVTWSIDGSVVVDCDDFFVPGDGNEYGRNVAKRLAWFRETGWSVEVPEDVVMPAI
jgi:hypothetical protein